jgi:hypothetical protein
MVTLKKRKFLTAALAKSKQRLSIAMPLFSK